MLLVITTAGITVELELFELLFWLLLPHTQAEETELETWLELATDETIEETFVAEETAGAELTFTDETAEETAEDEVLLTIPQPVILRTLELVV